MARSRFPDVGDILKKQADMQVYANPTFGIVHMKGDFSRHAVSTIYSIGGKMSGSAKMSDDNTLDLRSYPADSMYCECNTERAKW